MDIEKFEIPEITEEKLLKMYETIRPLVYDSKKAKMRYISLNVAKDELRNIAFNWSPEFLSSPTVDRPKLKPFKSVKFLSSGYSMLWKPSVDEVFAFVQNDEEILREAIAFSIEHVAYHESGDGNIGLATFYKRERPIAKEIEMKNKSILEATKIEKKFKNLKTLEEHYLSCKVCGGRLDGITTISPDYICNKINKYNKLILQHLKTYETVDKEALEKLKFKLLNKMLDDSLKAVKKAKNEKK